MPTKTENRAQYIHNIVGGMAVRHARGNFGVPNYMLTIIGKGIDGLKEEYFSLGVVAKNTLPCIRRVMNDVDKQFVENVWSQSTTDSLTTAHADSLIALLSSGIQVHRAVIAAHIWKTCDPRQNPRAMFGKGVPRPQGVPCKLALYRTIMRVIISAEVNKQPLLAAFLLDLIPDEVYDRYTKTKIRTRLFYSNRPQTVLADLAVLPLLIYISADLDMSRISRYAGWSMDYLYDLLRLYDSPFSDGLSTESITNIRRLFSQ